MSSSAYDISSSAPGFTLEECRAQCCLDSQCMHYSFDPDSNSCDIGGSSTIDGVDSGESGNIQCWVRSHQGTFPPSVSPSRNPIQHTRNQ